LDTTSSFPKALHVHTFRFSTTGSWPDGRGHNFNNISGSNRPVERPRMLRPSNRACTV